MTSGEYLADKSYPCHATGCQGLRYRSECFCDDHWFMLPFEMRQSIIEIRVPWHLATDTFTSDYARVVKKAIRHLAELEDVEPDTRAFDQVSPEGGTE